MDLLEIIRKSDKKPKELNEYIAKLIVEKRPSRKEYSEALTKGNDKERGTLVESLEHATQEKPEIAKPYISDVISCLEDKAPQVKWEASRVIGNIAKKFPKEAETAIDKLMKNTSDKGTVVRWSTAFALSEIAKHNEKLRPSLLKKIKGIVKNEENNGVKNVYLKALKYIESNS